MLHLPTLSAYKMINEAAIAKVIVDLKMQMMPQYIVIIKKYEINHEIFENVSSVKLSQEWKFISICKDILI